MEERSKLLWCHLDQRTPRTFILLWWKIQKLTEYIIWSRHLPDPYELVSHTRHSKSNPVKIIYGNRIVIDNNLLCFTNTHTLLRCFTCVAKIFLECRIFLVKKMWIIQNSGRKYRIWFEPRLSMSSRKKVKVAYQLDISNTWYWRVLDLGGTFCDIGGYNFYFLWIDIKTY